MINKNNDKNRVRTYKGFSAVLVTCFALFIGAASTATMRVHALTLPTCVDPTGNNLPCIMFISTLPPPKHTLSCQETSGQIFKCTFIVDKLSNGNKVVSITVYVPADTFFKNTESFRVVTITVNKTTTKIVYVPECSKTQILNPETHKCVDKPICSPGQHPALVNGIVQCVPPCERPDSDAKTDLNKNLKTTDCDLGDANEHGITPPPQPSCNSPNYNGTCLPTNNMTVAASGGKGTGPTCIDNCTTGTPAPPVICKTNPNDPSCPPILQPLTPPTSPSTQTCPDGSVIDTSSSCPTQSTPPPTNNNPPTPPSGSDNGNNNPPSSGGSDKSNSGNGGDGSGGGSSPSNPGSLPSP